MDRIRPKLSEPHKDRVTLSFSITRPTGTDAYTVSDIWASSTSSAYAIAVDGVAEYNGQHVDVIGGYLTSSAAQSTLPQFNIWVFSTPPASPVDNAAFTVTDAEMNTAIGMLTFDTWKASALNARSQLASGTRVSMKLGNTTSAYILAVLGNIYTPVANEVLTGYLIFERH